MYLKPAVGKPKPPNAVRLVCSMPGGAQSKLVLADDGHHYVVKFTNNPQHRRTLINEVIATSLLRALELAAAEFTPVVFDAAFLRLQPIKMDFGSCSVAVPAGLHYGSRYPFHSLDGSPAVYDHLPSTILRTTTATVVFLGAYVADQWMSNTDQRQAIFYRNTSKQWRIQLVDHGLAFGGRSWRFANLVGSGTFRDHVVYERVKSFAEVAEWIERIRQLPETAFETSRCLVPSDWIDGDRVALQSMLAQLIGRRRNLTRIAETAISHEKSPLFHLSPARRCLGKRVTARATQRTSVPILAPQSGLPLPDAWTFHIPIQSPVGAWLI
jgi:hypothetical protein